jgi:serine/threonine protein kinase
LLEISEVPRERIAIGSKLGEGNFGCVYQAEVKDLFISGVTSIVAVKMLLDGHTNKNRVNLIREMEVMKKIGKHDNIVKLLGYCTARAELMLIVECVLNGNLDKHLKDFRHDANMCFETDQNRSEGLFKLIPVLSNFAWQIASGMEYLATKKVT